MSFRIQRLIIILLIICMFPFAHADSRIVAPWESDDHKGAKQYDSMYLDLEHIKDGYFYAKVAAQTDKRVLLYVKKGSDAVHYDLDTNGKYEMFPLQFGSGKYTVSLYLQTTGKQYILISQKTFNADLKDPNSYQLLPSQYVNYQSDSILIEKTNQLCEGKTDYEKYQAIKKFIRNNFVYDYKRAMTVTSIEFQNIDDVYQKRMGTCFDLAICAASMLRSQGIRTKLSIGKVHGLEHAWTVVYIDGKSYLYDPTVALTGAVGQYHASDYKESRKY